MYCTHKTVIMVPVKLYALYYKIVVSGLFCAVFPYAHAQKTGGIIMNSGDTVFCEYTLKGNVISVKEPGSASKLIDAKGVQSVFSGHENRMVLFVKLETFTDNPDEIFDPLAKNRSEYDTVLLLTEEYNSPKIKLYSAFDKRKVQYFFVQKPGESKPVQLLIRYSVYYARVGELINWGSPNLTIERLYIDQLKGIMADCPKLSAGDFEVADYRDYSLKKICRKYNKRCS
jgi:hypothetical protein